MADYFTPTVIDPMIPLAAMLPLERMFLSRVFEEEVEDDAAYYFSEVGASDTVFLPAADVRVALDLMTPDQSRLAQKIIDEQADAILGEGDIELELCDDLWPDVLQDIVRRAPDIDHLTATMAFSCSRMRPDGFGGLAMLITAGEIRSASTHTLFDRFFDEARANGEIDHGHS